jgi:hypothetical protein
MKLYLISNTDLALETKERENCPHIHFIVEPHCDSFTTSMVWLEVLFRGSQEVRKYGCCVISYMDLSSSLDTLTDVDMKIIHNIEKKIKDSLNGVEVIKL